MLLPGVPAGTGSSWPRIHAATRFSGRRKAVTRRRRYARTAHMSEGQFHCQGNGAALPAPVKLPFGLNLAGYGLSLCRYVLAFRRLRNEFAVERVRRRSRLTDGERLSREPNTNRLTNMIGAVDCPESMGSRSNLYGLVLFGRKLRGVADPHRFDPVGHRDFGFAP